MVITCSDTRTISDAFISICGHAVRISDIRPSYSTIDVVVDGQMIPGIGTVDVAINSERVLITLISKNVSANTAVITFATEPNIIPPPPTATHHFDVYLQPYSWYKTTDVANFCISHGTEITGKIANIFSGITGWQYVSTDIVADEQPGLVTIRINLNQLGAAGIESMALPAVIAAIEGILIIGLLIVIISVAVIVGYELIRYISNVVDAAKQYTKDDVNSFVFTNSDSVVKAQLAECEKNFTDLIQQANCKKSVICGAANGVTDALKLSGTDCASLKINEAIDRCTAQFNIDNDGTKYKNCVNTVATDTGNEIKKKIPKEPMGWGIILLVGVGILGAVILTRK